MEYLFIGFLIILLGLGMNVQRKLYEQKQTNKIRKIVRDELKKAL